MNKFYNIITILIILLGLTVSVTAKESKKQKVNVLILQGPPEEEAKYDVKKNKIAFNVELIKEIARIEDWELSFTPTTIKNGYSRMKTDKRVSEALVYISSKYPENEEYLDYSTEPSLTFFPVIIANKESNINDYSELNNKEFAVNIESGSYKVFKEFARKTGFEFKPVKCTNISDTVKYVSEHKDSFGVLADKAFIVENYNYPNTKVLFYLSDFYQMFFSVRKGKDQEVIQTIDRYLSTWKKSKTSPYYIYYNEYLKSLKTAYEVPLDSYIKPIHYIVAGIILFTLFIWILSLRYKIKQKSIILKSKEEDIKLTLMNIDDGVVITNNKGEVELINAVAENLLGYTQSQAKGESITRIFTTEDLESLKELISPIESILSNSSTINNSGTITLRNLDGVKSVITYTTSPIIIDHVLSGIILVLQDITLETNQRIKIIQSEKELQQILQSINEGILFFDTNLNVIRYNIKILDFLAKDISQNIIGKNHHDLFPDEKKNYDSPVHKSLRENTTATTILEREDNRVLLVSASPVADQNNIIIGIIETFLDITDLRKKEEALQASEEKYRMLIENQSDLFLKLSPDGSIQFVSPSLCKMFNRKEQDLLNQSYQSINIRQNIFNRIIDDLSRPLHKSHFEVEHDTVQGKRWISWNNSGVLNSAGEIDYIIAVGRDITDSKMADEKLKQVQKMEAIGQLAGGIAHDFNNMLGGIVGFAELISMRQESSETIKNFCNQIIKTSERAADLTQQLLSFARKGKAVSSKIDAHSAIRGAITILRRSVNKNINIQTKLEAENSMIIGDPAQIQSSILNLGINARDAMNDMEGCFTIETTTTRLSKSYCEASNFDITPGDYLLIKATDTGEGMTKETMERIFEPFFTTKEIGKGTGLGLASIFGTVTLHHGAITAYSELGSGTEFHIFLPLATPEYIEANISNDDYIINQLKTKAEKKCILVIDDEEIIRVLSKSLLEDMGYKVLTAQNGAEGIELYKTQRHEINLIILDVIMPKLSGKETLRRLMEINPEVKVIISSGFAQSDKIEDFLELGAQTFIKKPYRQKDLFRAIDESMH